MNCPSLLDLNPQRILVRGVNWLGDAVMTTPALMRLRERFPDALIALLTPEKLRGLWLHHPAIDEIIGFKQSEGVLQVARKVQVMMWPDSEDCVSLGAPASRRRVRSSQDRSEGAKRLPRGAFDLALVLPNSPRSALETWLARVPLRVGYARLWRNFFLTAAIQPRPGIAEMRKRSVAEIKRLISAEIPPIEAAPCAPEPERGHSCPQQGDQPAHSISPPRVSSFSLSHRMGEGRGEGASPFTFHDSDHQIHHYLHLVAALGANPEPLLPQLVVTPEELNATAQKFNLTSQFTNNRPLFGLNPGAEYGPAKRWPPERFIAAAQEIQKRTNCLWLIFGAKGDVLLANEIESAIGNQKSAIGNVLNLAGRTSLRELCAAIKLCRLLLTNDTGPMHIAAALNVPVVVPFGSTSPELTGPIPASNTPHQLLKSNAPCSPCFLRECPIDFRCMKGITVDEVVEAVMKLAA